MFLCLRHLPHTFPTLMRHLPHPLPLQSLDSLSTLPHLRTAAPVASVSRTHAPTVVKVGTSAGSARLLTSTVQIEDTARCGTKATASIPALMAGKPGW